jgi:hypothetical protein
MPVGDKQNLIIDIVSTVLGEPAKSGISFDWLINKHTPVQFGKHMGIIEKVFHALRGDAQANKAKRTSVLSSDSYFGGRYNFLLEFDEFQHFSTARLKTLDLYPSDVKVNFSIQSWKQFCIAHSGKADAYRKTKRTKDFDFDGGRTAQRAYLDCFRDLLPTQHGLQPTIRISEFEVIGIHSNNNDACAKIEKLIKSRIG